LALDFGRFNNHMSFLFIGTTGDRAGHSLVAWTIARRLVEKGLNVGFLKPFGTNAVQIAGMWTDPDAFLFREILKLHEPIERICPYILTEDVWRQNESKEIIEKIKSLAGELSISKDVLIIMGSRQIFFDDASGHVSDIPLINGLAADFILVNRYRELSRSIYSILSISSLLKDRIKGIILNRVPPEKLEEIRNHLVPSLVQKGVPVTATLPEDPILSFRSLAEIKEALDGQILQGKESLDQPVSGMTVGSSDLRGKLQLFKRAYNKIILLAPSAGTEIEGTSTHRPVAGIILTGGRNPAPQLLQTAENAGIPLILVKGDTFSVLERLDRSSPPLSPKDEIKVRYFTGLMDNNGALDGLIQSIPSRSVASAGRQ
jgi:BioD-like phosphotransacetylase family protein